MTHHAAPSPLALPPAPAVRARTRQPPGAADALPVFTRRLETPLGPMLAAARDDGLCRLEFLDHPEPHAHDLPPAAPRAAAHLDALADQLAAYFARQLTRFTVALHTPGTEFQLLAWRALGEIPFGEIRSYAQQAAAIGRPTATRAVARANGDNRIAIVIPCHRVLGADGSLTGYGGQLWRKQWLLDHEKRLASPTVASASCRWIAQAGSTPA